MARRPRGLAAGEIYHVVNRGALRAPLFADAVDARLFLGAMRDALARHPVDLLAWCVMPNHWHLLLRPRSAATLPPFMRWLTLAHSRRWQARHARPGQGTLYQGRYRSARVAGDAQLRPCCATSSATRCGRVWSPAPSTGPGRACAYG